MRTCALGLQFRWYGVIKMVSGVFKRLPGCCKTAEKRGEAVMLRRDGDRGATRFVSCWSRAGVKARE